MFVFFCSSVSVRSCACACVHVRVRYCVCTCVCSQRNLRGVLETGHSANIFCAKFMPCSDSRQLVTCAGDSQIKSINVEYEKVADKKQVCKEREKR